MGLVLPEAHPARAALCARGIACLGSHERALRIGIINLMPNAEAYEPMLLEPLGASAHWVEPVWIRLASHGYASSDSEHLATYYRDFARAGGLSGLILTGAPVEELTFEEVRYFPELRALLAEARMRIPSTLGLCWGGMALAHLLGIEKRVFAKKLFGIYPLQGPHGECAQSRHAGLDDRQLESAAEHGELHLIAGSALIGHTILETADGRFLMHLGHPEYTPARLRFESQRDRELGRADVHEPHGMEGRSAETPLPHGLTFFAQWLRSLAKVECQTCELTARP